MNWCATFQGGTYPARFIRSYLRFAPPNSRLEEVASDAGLQEKSLSELQRLADTLSDGVDLAEREHNSRSVGVGGCVVVQPLLYAVERELKTFTLAPVPQSSGVCGDWIALSVFVKFYTKYFSHWVQ